MIQSVEPSGKFGVSRLAFGVWRHIIGRANEAPETPRTSDGKVALSSAFAGAGVLLRRT